MTTNRKRGEFEIRLRGEIYAIRPTMTLLALLEEKFGTLWQLGERISTGALGITALVALLQFLISHGRDSAPTQEEILEDIVRNGAAAQVGAIAGFLTDILSSRVDSLNAGN